MSEKGFKKINFPYSLSMDTARPVDYNSFFTSLSDAENAAKTAVKAGKETSKYYFGQLLTVADLSDSNDPIVKHYKIDSDKTLKELAAEYSVSRGLSSYIDAHGNTVIQIRDDIYNDIEGTYTTTKIASGNWDKAYSTVNNLSGGWQSTTAYTSSASGRFDSLYSTIETVSAKWNDSYTTQNQWGNKWTSAYLALKSTSANWEDAYSSVKTTSARWNDASSVIESVSSNISSVYSTVYSTSGRWEDAFTRGNLIYGVIPSETWSDNNSLADKNYVQEQIRNQSFVFRGSFSTWASVPTTSSGYNSDITGSKIPENNDYIIVLDDSANIMTVAVSSNPVGEIVSEDIMDFYGESIIVTKNTKITEETITLLEANSVESVHVYRTGSWRYKYVGTWVEGYDGKRNWYPEYRISQYPFTSEQLAAINSGITKQKSDKIVENSAALSKIRPLTGNWNQAYSAVSEISSDAKSVYASVNSASADWNTVVEKIAEDYFKYYTASAWAILTDDDTDYSLVPSGMVLIYEDDGSTPVVSSIYTKDDGYLTLSKDITYDYDFGILYIGGNPTFDFDTKTLTIPGSSDVETDTVYNYDTGILKLSENISWNSSTSSLVLGVGNKYDSDDNVVTLAGYGENSPVVTTCTVTNILTNAKTSNTATYVNKGQQYMAVITPISDSYYISSISCTMGGNAVLPYGDTSFSISSVTGDIVITAVGALKAATTYSVTNNLTHAVNSNTSEIVTELSEYQAFITAESGYSITSVRCTMGGVEQTVVDNYISIVNVTGDIVITAVAAIVVNPKSTYYLSNRILNLARDISYDSVLNVVTLGSSVSYGNDRILTFTGVSAESQITYATVTNNLDHAENSNLVDRVVIGGSYTAAISAKDGFKLNTVSCTMNGTEVPVSDDYVITITSVNGDIVITATTTYIGHTDYDTSTGIIKLAVDAVSSTDGIITLGYCDRLNSGILELSGYSVSNYFSFDVTDGILSLSNDTALSVDDIISLGENAKYDSETKTIGLSGKSLN